MTEPQSIIAGGSQAPKLASVPSSAQIPGLNRQDTGSSYGHEEFEPLPPGCWTLDFHGNCPRCHHHNRALRVQVRVTLDARHVSYVHCERCQDRWAAFGGRNSTRISLLSSTTTEPDLAARGVRYRLIDIVNLATGKVPLDTLPESLSLAPSRQSSMKAHTASKPSADLPTPRASISVEHTEVSLAQSHQHLKVSTCDAANHAPPATIRGNTRQLISILKAKVTKRFPMLHRSSVKQRVSLLKLSGLSTRQIEKSPVRTPTAEDLGIVSVKPSTSAIQSQKIPVDRQTPVPYDFQGKVVEPSKRLTEVVAFVASLEKSTLKSMSEQERIQWMREQYTTFKSRKKGPIAPLSFSTIVQESTPTEFPSSSHRTRDRFSIEVSGVGAHVEDLENVLDAALRRGSITFSEATSEAPSAPDDNSFVLSPRNSGQHLLQRLRHGSATPQSLPNTRPSSSRTRAMFRNSYDAQESGGGSSSWSTRAQSTSRFSQVSTLNSSTMSVDRSVLQAILHHVEDSEGSGTETPMPSPPRSVPGDQQS
jgi:hypothetical protein